ncbi:MAG: valine--tRNA ligase [SAR324 cluster bacterium]|nr:valine--tRNA ligase [SAR324 cluster bacterium]
MSSLAKAYDPQAFEKQIAEQWESSGAFRADANSEKPAFTISMPPPNATGQLHVGHAVMLVLEDIFIRWQRMDGHEALWLPGTDHAAIATENVVLQQIKTQEGIADPRSELGRDEVLRRIAEYVKNSQGTIRNQVKALGSSCDWSRERYTMDPQLNRCVNETFKRMYEDGLIFRGPRIVNWDPLLKTNVSDDEVERKDTNSPFFTFQYGPFQIGTVRPETKFGDKYVVIHPDDQRYMQYKHGETFECEWINGKITATIIKDDVVDPEFGTGVMTITPWHDHVDFGIAERHGLEKEPIIDFEGNLLSIANEFEGMSIDEGRPQIVEKLKSKGLLVKIDTEYTHSKAFNSRGGGAIEPQIREQWFIDVNKAAVEWKGKKHSLKEVMIDVVSSGDISLVPDRFDSTYFYWIDNLQDWCISRQIWWGHRIPVYYRDAETKVSLQQLDSAEGWEQDPDTLDTWFSSALWTWSTLVDPELAEDFSLTLEEILECSPDFQKFHPTNIMETGYDILFFWVARMILMTTYMLQDVPFKTVYLHGLIRTRDGKKMSKSEPKTVIDPLVSIEEYGADALRIALILGTGPGQDLRLFPEKMESSRRFANKIWNAGRYILITIPENTPLVAPQNVKSELAQWLLHGLNDLISSTQTGLEAHRLSDVADNLKSFFWGDFCDWYLEMDKNPQRSAEDNQVLAYAFSSLIKLLHPYVPFVTEALWGQFKQPEMLVVSEWPQVQPYQFKESHGRIEIIKESISQIRALREKAKIGLDKKVSATLDSAKHAELFREHHQLIIRLARLSELKISEKTPEAVSDMLSSYFQDTLASIEASALDWKKEIETLQKKLKMESGFVQKSLSKLDNPGFLKQAPEKVVTELRDKVDATEKTLSALKQQILELEKLEG